MKTGEEFRHLLLSKGSARFVLGGVDFDAVARREYDVFGLRKRRPQRFIRSRQLLDGRKGQSLAKRQRHGLIAAVNDLHIHLRAVPPTSTARFGSAAAV